MAQHTHATSQSQLRSAHGPAQHGTHAPQRICPFAFYFSSTSPHQVKLLHLVAHIMTPTLLSPHVASRNAAFLERCSYLLRTPRNILNAIWETPA
jgi:hypothetical protein